MVNWQEQAARGKELWEAYGYIVSVIGAAAAGAGATFAFLRFLAKSRKRALSEIGILSLPRAQRGTLNVLVFDFTGDDKEALLTEQIVTALDESYRDHANVRRARLYVPLRVKEKKVERERAAWALVENALDWTGFDVAVWGSAAPDHGTIFPVIQARGDPVPVYAAKGHSLLQGLEVPLAALEALGPRIAAAGAKLLIQAGARSLERWERQICGGLCEQDIDLNEVKIVLDSGRRLMRQARGFDSELEFLEHLRMLTPLGFTNGADVVFGKESWKRLPQCCVTWVVFEQDEAGSGYRDSTIIKGPMLRVMRETFDKAHATLDLGLDAPRYSINALREGLVNAIVHADYSCWSQGIFVKSYSDRIVISNPGTFPSGITPRILATQHPSIPVNPDLAIAFFYAGLMERIGRGTQMIVSKCVELGCKPPAWKSGPEGISLTLFGRRDK